MISKLYSASIAFATLRFPSEEITSMPTTTSTADWRTTPTSELDLGPVCTRVLEENDRVRIWEMALEPGEELALHKHDLDFININVKGDRLAGYVHSEAEGVFTQDVDVEVVPGKVYYVPRGGIEIAKNTGTEPYYAILIELKD
jgi:hypothetical protein